MGRIKELLIEDANRVARAAATAPAIIIEQLSDIQDLLQLVNARTEKLEQKVIEIADTMNPAIPLEERRTAVFVNAIEVSAMATLAKLEQWQATEPCKSCGVRTNHDADVCAVEQGMYLQ